MTTTMTTMTQKKIFALCVTILFGIPLTILTFSKAKTESPAPIPKYTKSLTISGATATISDSYIFLGETVKSKEYFTKNEIQELLDQYFVLIRDSRIVSDHRVIFSSEDAENALFLIDDALAIKKIAGLEAPHGVMVMSSAVENPNIEGTRFFDGSARSTIRDIIINFFLALRNSYNFSKDERAEEIFSIIFKQQ